MKTISTLLIASLCSASVFAADEGRLTVTVSSTEVVQVFKDNRSYRMDDKALVLNSIRPGQHTIQVYSNSYGNNKNRNNRNNVLYSSTIYVKPNYDVDIMINRFGKALVDERDLRYRNDDDWNKDDNWNKNDRYNRNRNFDNEYDVMNDGDFNRYLQQIRSQWFGNGKMNSAKDGLNRNYFTTLQVRQVLQLFNSESDKLELAKLFYNHLADRQNVYQLYDVFSFKSSKDELDQYIRNNRW